MEEALRVLLPSLLTGHTVRWKIINHGSKTNLLRDLPVRMRAYAQWHTPHLKALVLVDRDLQDCKHLKAQLEDIARKCGLTTKSTPDRAGHFKVCNRIVVEELEAWLLGDVEALAATFPGVPRSLGNQARYRVPDVVAGGTCEALLRVLHKAGHYRGIGRLPKIDVARKVARNMSVAANRSQSFQMFVRGLEALMAQ